MDNYTMIQNAGKRRPDIERAGFSALSRADQADRWAAWQASADMPRAGAGATYSYDAMDGCGQGDAYMDDGHAMRDAGRRAEACSRRDNAWREEDIREPRHIGRDDHSAAEPPAPPKRSFALYNGILAHHAQVFGKHI